MTVMLGSMSRVELREAWKDEAMDFTLWLAIEANLKMLGDTLGLDLELETTE